MFDREEVLNIIRSRRRYASYWEWRDQASTEFSVLETYCQTRERQGWSGFECLERPSQDPPDFVVRLEGGHLVGIELTEFVCDEAVRRNERITRPEDRVYRDWRSPEVLQRLREIVARKDNKQYHVPDSVPVELVIHTDEYIVRYDEYAPLIEAACFGPVARLAKAFLLFSYDPDHEHCPMCELPLTRRPTSA